MLFCVTYFATSPILNISAEYVEMADVVQFLTSPPDGHVASKEFDLF